MKTTIHREERLAAGLAAAGLAGFDVALVLGSGLGAFADRLEEPLVVSFAEVDGMPTSSVPGHAGRFVLGALAGRRVLVQQGRVHLYEGRAADEVTCSVRAMALSGCRNLLLTNAAGCSQVGWAVPGLMRLVDHLNFQARPPLRRGEQGRGSPYHPALGAALDEAAREVGVTLHTGVYAATLGPAYETPAEVRLLAALGAQAVGMSTVAEASAAWAAGMRVGAVSCLSNLAAGLSPVALAHEDVVAAGAEVARDLTALLEATLPRL